MPDLTGSPGLTFATETERLLHIERIVDELRPLMRHTEGQPMLPSAHRVLAGLHAWLADGAPPESPEDNPTPLTPTRAEVVEEYADLIARGETETPYALLRAFAREYNAAREG